MSSVFVIQNQQGQFLSRQKEWVEKTEIAALYKTPHRDLAINELFEVTSKETDTRAKVVVNERTRAMTPLMGNRTTVTAWSNEPTSQWMWQSAHLPVGVRNCLASPWQVSHRAGTLRENVGDRRSSCFRIP